MRNLFYFLSIILLASVSLKAQQSEPLPPADLGTDNYKWVYSAILKPRCLHCHSGEAGGNNGSLASYADLKAVITSAIPEKCMFYQVLGNGNDCAMPPQNGGKCIGTRGLRAANWWIKKGAPQN